MHQIKLSKKLIGKLYVLQKIVFHDNGSGKIYNLQSANWRYRKIDDIVPKESTDLKTKKDDKGSIPNPSQKQEKTEVPDPRQSRKAFIPLRTESGPVKLGKSALHSLCTEMLISSSSILLKTLRNTVSPTICIFMTQLS